MDEKAEITVDLMEYLNRRTDTVLTHTQKKLEQFDEFIDAVADLRKAQQRWEKSRGLTKCFSQILMHIRGLHVDKFIRNIRSA